MPNEQIQCNYHSETNVNKIYSKSRNIFIDIFRLLLSLFVVLIHFDSTKTFLPVCRVAVPMFFMLSGFFLYDQNISTQNTKNIKFIQSSFVYLLISFVIYFVYDFSLCLINHQNIIEFFSTIFNKNLIIDVVIFNRPLTSGPFWFLIALFVTSIIHYIFTYFNLCKIYKYIAPLILVCTLFINGYLHFFIDYSFPLEHTRNVLLFGFPMFAIGFALGKFRNNAYTKKQTSMFIILGIICLLFSFIEKRMIEMEFYISSIFASIFLILGLNSIEVKSNKFISWFYKWIGKKAPFYIYILHVLVYEIFIQSINVPPLAKCMLTFIICFLIYEFMHLVKLYIGKFIASRQKLSKH